MVSPAPLEATLLQVSAERCASRTHVRMNTCEHACIYTHTHTPAEVITKRCPTLAANDLEPHTQNLVLADNLLQMLTSPFTIISPDIPLKLEVHQIFKTPIPTTTQFFCITKAKWLNYAYRNKCCVL